ncbi:hypothetical protein POTOM_041369 [Populus tomentosa]|uniref:Tim10-like domain-containing protein n=1 Tax=Populus tomentosa TaxID=118781 RepID=A0A8X7YVX2_POPTO|nr:hypothetical protein POTOM_041369 [Populus tomentosa]
MDSFSSHSSMGSGSPQISAEDLKDQLKNQLAQAYAQEFLEGNLFAFGCFWWNVNSAVIGGSFVVDVEIIAHIYTNVLSNEMMKVNLQTVREKCFEKCITRPGSSLSGSESSCTSRCVERYIEATGIISRALFSAPR